MFNNIIYSFTIHAAEIEFLALHELLDALTHEEGQCLVAKSLGRTNNLVSDIW